MTTTRRVRTGLALAALLLVPASAAQAVAAPQDDRDDPTPITPHIKSPLGGLLTERPMPVDWRILGVPL